MLTYQVIEQPNLRVAGMFGEGIVEESDTWVPLLWEKLTTYIWDLTAEEKVTTPTLWGLMSDADEWLMPWKEVGQYLAGMEISADTVVDEALTVWELPAQTYLTIHTTSDKLTADLTELFDVVFPETGYELVGAPQECYCNDLRLDEVVLYVPIQKPVKI